MFALSKVALNKLKIEIQALDMNPGLHDYLWEYLQWLQLRLYKCILLWYMIQTKNVLFNVQTIDELNCKVLSKFCAVTIVVRMLYLTAPRS